MRNAASLLLGGLVFVVTACGSSAGRNGFDDSAGTDTNTNQPGDNGSTSGDPGSGTFGALYPGAGIEGHVGRVGLRLDVGDMIYFDNGARNNLKVSVGPYIRF